MNAICARLYECPPFILPHGIRYNVLAQDHPAAVKFPLQHVHGGGAEVADQRAHLVTQETENESDSGS